MQTTQASIRSTSSPAEHGTSSLPKPPSVIRQWATDAEYIADQQKECSWSHLSKWGEAAAVKFVYYGNQLGTRLWHDDTVADFGGNDGYVAYQFYAAHKIKPLVVDCDPLKIEFAQKTFGLSTLERFIEDMPELGDKSVDWAFCSHTLEHTRDINKAMTEIARVVKRGCFFVLPLERKKHAKCNHAHAVSFCRPMQWMRLLAANGWKIIAHQVL